MTGELSAYGVLFPPILVSAALAALATALCRRLLAARNLYRHIWHPALFDLAVFVLLLAAIQGLLFE